MARMRVIVSKLNQRKQPVTETSDKTNIVGVVTTGFTFESVEERTNRLGSWYSDGDGHFYWGGGLEEVQAGAIQPEATSTISFDENKMGWAFKGPDGIDILTLWNKNLKGQNTRVAVLDSGVNMNIPDLNAAIKDKQKDVKSFVDGITTVDDDFGHGTNCASVLAARGGKIYGTAPMCELIVGKVRTANIMITPDATLKALKWACEERTADIVSMSFSGTLFVKEIADYISQQSNPPFNKLFIASVDDIGSFDLVNPYYPANYPGCISVGSYSKNRIPCESSGWNKNLFFISPGDLLKVYQADGSTTTLDCGTSYACPFTAGIIACIVSHFKTNGIPYTSSLITNAITNPTCIDTLPGSNPLQTGKGIINPIKVLQKIT